MQVSRLCGIDKALSGFGFYLVGLAVFGNLHIVGVFVQLESCRCLALFYKHPAILHMEHFVNAGAGFFHNAKQHVVLVKLFVFVAVAVNLKFCAGQCIVGVILIHLRQAEISINALVFKVDFHHSPVLADRYRNYLVGENKAGYAL